MPKTTMEFVVQIDRTSTRTTQGRLVAALARAIEYALDADIEGAEALNRDTCGRVSVAVKGADNA